MHNHRISTYKRTLLALGLCAAVHIAYAQPTGTSPAPKPASPAAKPAEVKPEGPSNNISEYEKRYQERITKDRLYGVYIPKNLDDAMAQLDKQISAETKILIKAIPEDSVCMALHRRLGVWMINNWGFYEGSRLSHYLRSAGVTFPDDQADFLILAYHRHLHGKSLEIKQLATYFRDMRHKQYEEEVKKGEVVGEQTRQRPRPEKPAQATTTPPPVKPANPTPPAPVTPKGNSKPKQ
jgi:hypothetical protein